VTRLWWSIDEPHLLRALVLNLTNRGYDVTTATTAALALAQIRRLPPDLLVPISHCPTWTA
jgi:two-component system, OmpR family, KDP operon response regulator KdpE